MTSLALAAVAGGATFVVFGTVGFPALVAWPVLTGIAYPFVRYPSGDPIVTFDRLWIVGLVGIVAINAGRVRHTRETRALAAAMTVLVCVFGLRAAATAGASLGTYKVWIDAVVLPLVLFYATIQLSTSVERVRALSGALMAGGAVLAALGIADLVLGLNLAGYVGGEQRFEAGLDVFRLSGPYPVPEPYGLSLVICLAATGYRFLTSRGGARMVAACLGALELTAIGLTLFRAAWIAALLVLVTTFGLRRGRWGRLIVVGTVIGIVLFGATSQLQSTQLFSQRIDNTDNVWGRLATYEQGLSIFRGAPIFGVGIERYHSVAEGLRPVEVKGVASVTFPHSTFVGVLAEQGLVGFAVLVAACFAAWRLLRALGRATTVGDGAVLAGAATGAALGYLVMSLTLTMLPYGPSNAFFAVLLGLVAARLDIARREPVAGAGTV